MRERLLRCYCSRYPVSYPQHHPVYPQKRSLSRLLKDGSTVSGLLRPADSPRPLILLRRPSQPDSEPYADLVRIPGEDSEKPPQCVIREVRRGVSGRWEVDMGCQGRLVAAIVKPDTVLVRNFWQKDEASKQQFNT